MPSPAKAAIQMNPVRFKTVLRVVALGLSTTGRSTITDSQGIAPRRPSTVGHRASRVAMTLAATLLLGACAGTQGTVNRVGDTMGGSAAGSQQAAALLAPSYLSETPARIVTQRKRLQCVPYARQVSKVSIQGDASTWWSSAKGRYERGGKPKVGSVLVLKRTGRNRYGHIAVVTRILGSREIIIDHANWLNRGRLHLGTPVREFRPTTIGRRCGSGIHSGISMACAATPLTASSIPSRPRPRSLRSKGSSPIPRRGPRGAAAGGLAGSRIGDGRGQLAASAGGTLLSFLVGGVIGRNMAEID